MAAHSSTASSSSSSSNVTSGSSGGTPQRQPINSNEDTASSTVGNPSVAKKKTAATLGVKDSATIVPDANSCRYKSRKCDNARSVKRSGHLHQFCLYHRDKANQTQRKFDRQRRAERVRHAVIKAANMAAAAASQTSATGNLVSASTKENKA